MVYAYIPITITNSESTATSTDFQQLVNVDLSYYTSFLNSDLSNTFFSSDTAGSDIITSWLESGNTSPFNSVNFWIYLPNGVGASSSITVYLQVDLSGTSHFNTTTTGVAPQLTSSYGEYDDGANIFTYYQRWGGLSALPSGWSSTGVDITYNSDYTTILSSSTSYGAIISTFPITSTPFVLETYALMYEPNKNPRHQFGLYGSSTPNTDLDYVLGYSNTNGDVGVYNPAISSGAYNYAQATSNAIVGFALPNTTSIYAYQNYQLGYSNTALTSSSFGYLQYGSASESSPINIYWTRVRAYPPNGIMPFVTAGTPSNFPYYNTTTYEDLL